MAHAMWNCCHLGARSVYTIQPCTSFQCHIFWSHIPSVHVCLAVTFHQHFWQNDQDLLRATVVKGVEQILKQGSAQKVDCAEEHFPAIPTGNQTCSLWILNPPLQHWVIPASQLWKKEKKREGKKDKEIQLHDHGAEHWEGGCVPTVQLGTQVGCVCVCGRGRVGGRRSCCTK